MKRTPLTRRTPLKAKTGLTTRTPLKATRKPATKRKGKKPTTESFASLARSYELPGWITGKKHLRWSSPVEKGIAWEVVKKIVRLQERDCYTCWRKNLVEAGLKADSGHCYPVGQVGSNNALSWDLRLIHLQCSYCNGVGEGEQGLYEERVRREYGEQFLLEARQRRYKSDPVKDWKAKLDELWTIYQGLRETEKSQEQPAPSLSV